MRGRCAADGCRCGDDVSFMCYVPFTFMCGTFLSLIAIEMCRLCVANVLSCVAYVSLMCRLCVVHVWCILVTDFWSLTLTHHPVIRHSSLAHHSHRSPPTYRICVTYISAGTQQPPRQRVVEITHRCDLYAICINLCGIVIYM